MIHEVKYYRCEFDKTPSLDDIKECHQIATENNCWVELRWVLKWSGRYSTIITPEDNPEDKYNNDIKKIQYGL